MDDTVKVWDRDCAHCSSSTRLASKPSIRVGPFGSTGAPAWPSFPLSTFLAIGTRQSAFRSTRRRKFQPVAYSLSPHSRLGYSPNGVLDRAYHNTTGECRSKTNNGPDKKSGLFSVGPRVAPSTRPVAQQRRDSTLAGKGWNKFRSENSHDQFSPNLVNPKED
jgi:hypothetical protein